MNFNPYIYIQYYQSNLLNYLPPIPVSHPSPSSILTKLNISFVTEVMEQPGSETHEHNAVAIRERNHTNVDKQRMLLDDSDVAPPRGVV